MTIIFPKIRQGAFVHRVNTKINECFIQRGHIYLANFVFPSHVKVRIICLKQMYEGEITYLHVHHLSYASVMDIFCNC